MNVAHLPEPTRVRLWLKPSPQPDRLLDEFRRMIRETVREEMRRAQDRQSFAAASPWMTQEEVMAYLRMGRTNLHARRTARKLAKTSEEAAKAFAPEYGSGASLRFHRRELDAWMAQQRT